jgi:hypothetical protein
MATQSTGEAQVQKSQGMAEVVAKCNKGTPEIKCWSERHRSTLSDKGTKVPNVNQQ